MFAIIEIAEKTNGLGIRHISDAIDEAERAAAGANEPSVFEKLCNLRNENDVTIKEMMKKGGNS